jgi:hypothetical protein
MTATLPAGVSGARPPLLGGDFPTRRAEADARRAGRDVRAEGGFDAVKFDVNLDGRVFYPCPRGR